MIPPAEQAESDKPEPNPAPLWPYLLFCAILAAWLTTTQINRLHDGDSVLFQLHSRHFWSPFMWEQDRVGMIWPLLTKPIVHPLANLLTQNGIMIFCGLAFPFVYHRLFFPCRSPIAILLANSWLVAFSPDLILDNLYIVCMYPSAIFLGGCGLLCLAEESNHTQKFNPIRLLLGIVLLALAHWAYVAVVIILLPVAILQKNRLGIFAVLFAFSLGFGLMQYVRGRYPGIDVTPTKLNPISEIPGHILLFVKKLPSLDKPYWCYAACLMLVSLAMMIITHKTKDLLSLASWLLVGLFELTVMSSLQWPCEMDHHPRYILFFILSLAVASFYCVSAFMTYAVKQSQFLCNTLKITSAALLFAATVWQFGLPSVNNLRNDFNQRFGRNTQAFIDCKADAIGDGYWQLWPAVYHLELTRYELGLPPLENAVGVRCSAYWPTWKKFGESGFIVAVPIQNDPNTSQAGEERGLEKFEFIKQYQESILLYRTKIVFLPYPGKPKP